MKVPKEIESLVLRTTNKLRQVRIGELAYYKWLNSGKPVGRDMEFWLQAEREYLCAEKTVNGT